MFDAKRGPAARTAASPTPTRRPGAAHHQLDRRPTDGALVGAAGHLHPGGLWTDLKLTRDGPHDPPVPLQGGVLRAGGRGLLGRLDDRHAARLARAVRKGDVMCVSGTYDTPARVAVRVAMAIMPAMFDPGGTGGDPFTIRRGRRGRRSRTATCGRTTTTAAASPASPTRAGCSRGPSARTVPSRSAFVYGQGDLATAARPPGGPAGRRADVREPRPGASHVPHDHRVQGAVQRSTGIASRSPTARSSSTPASSASGRGTSLPRRTAPRGRLRASSSPAPTPTTLAASIRSCAARSRSRGAEPGIARRAGLNAQCAASHPSSPRLSHAGHVLPARPVRGRAAERWPLGARGRAALAHRARRRAGFRGARVRGAR